MPEMNDNLFLEIFNDEEVHPIEDYIKATYLARKKYNEAKNIYETKWNDIVLQTNFDKVNEVRKELNLPDIGNSDQRKAYWKSKVQHLEYDMNMKYDYYLYCKTITEILQKGVSNE